jgi:hypothetical protein
MATFVNGTSYDTGLIGSGDTPIIRISNITNPDAEYLRTGETFDSKFQVGRGDLLVSWSASFKSTLWSGPPGVLNQHIFRVQERAGTSRSYLRHAIEAAFDEMQRNVVGIGMMHLRRSDFLGHRVPCPPIDVQDRVAKYLDWIEADFSGSEPDIDDRFRPERELIRQIRSVSAKLDEASRLRREATLKESALVTAHLVELSDEFERAGHLEDVLTGKPRNGWSARCDNDPEGVPVLTLSAVTGFRYQPMAFKRTSMPVDEDAQYWLTPGDLLVTRSNTPELVGHAALYDGTPHPCIYPDLMMKVPVDHSLADPRFVWFWLQTPLARDFIVRQAKGTSPTMKKISQATVMAIPFPSGVPLERQRKVVRRLDQLQGRLDAIRPEQASIAHDLDAVLPAFLGDALSPRLGTREVV